MTRSFKLLIQPLKDFSNIIPMIVHLAIIITIKKMITANTWIIG